MANTQPHRLNRAARFVGGMFVAGIWVALGVWLTSMNPGDTGSWIGTIAADALILCVVWICGLIAVMPD